MRYEMEARSKDVAYGEWVDGEGRGSVAYLDELPLLPLLPLREEDGSA